MPELPEVETVIRGISPKILNQNIENCKFSLKKLRFRLTPNFIKNIIFTKVISVSRRAKYILINLNNGKTIIIHLGMSGRIIVTSNNENKKIKHTHMTLYFSNGLIMKFIDPRRFGSIIHLDSSKIDAFKFFNHLGHEPLNNRFNAKYLMSVCQNKKSSIKSVIMNQKIVVGVGNIYASEALFYSFINPTIQANKLTPYQYTILVRNIKNVLNKAIKMGGSSINDYSMVNGMLGHFQNKLKVYDREGKNCLKKTCKGQILRIVIAQRSSFFCSQCQK